MIEAAMQKSLHFLYHEIRPATTAYAYVTPLAEFEAHCLFFAQTRTAEGAGKLRPEITFDDGHQSDVEFALPALEQQGLRATFFITAGWTGERAGFMGWPELRKLLATGHRVGAHSLTHKLLTGCSDQELQQELGTSRRLLEDKLGVEVSSMSLPGGRANARVMAACRAAGYSQIFTSAPRAESMDDRPSTVGRLNLTAGTSTAWLGRVLDPTTGMLASLERKHRLKEGAQRLLGDRLYARLWAIANRQGGDAAQEATPA